MALNQSQTLHQPPAPPELIQSALAEPQASLRTGVLCSHLTSPRHWFSFFLRARSLPAANRNLISESLS